MVEMVKSEKFSKEWFTEIYADQVKEKNDKLLKEEGALEKHLLLKVYSIINYTFFECLP